MSSYTLWVEFFSHQTNKLTLEDYYFNKSDNWTLVVGGTVNNEFIYSGKLAVSDYVGSKES